MLNEVKHLARSGVKRPLFSWLDPSCVGMFFVFLAVSAVELGVFAYFCASFQTMLKRMARKYP